MSWHQYDKGQPVMTRALGGWVKGHVSETYENSVSVSFNRGAQVITVRVYDLRNIKPWQAKPSSNSTLNDQLSLDS